MNRRAFLGGCLCLTLVKPARAAALELTAAPLKGVAGRFGYNGASPGPILRGKPGAPLAVRLVNGLAEPTSLSLPGSGFAGLTAPALAPGEARDLAFTPAEPGFSLYGPYGPIAAAGQLGAGLFGAIVVDEMSPPAVDLDAIAVFSGADATALRANAEPAPLALAAPPGGRVRLRLANASPDLVLMLKASGATVTIVAIDGQPCETFSPRGGEFPLAPSARFELMFDLDGPFELALAGADPRPALRVAPKGARLAARGEIAALPVNPRLPAEIALEKARRVKVVVSGAADKGFALNGVGGAEWPAKPLFNVARGAPVALTLVNETAEPQTLRLEGHVARLLHALDDGWDPYWRDALLIGPGHTLQTAFVADAAGKWPLASASPERRAKGMAGWFAVT